MLDEMATDMAEIIPFRPIYRPPEPNFPAKLSDMIKKTYAITIS
jgi:hypothetical protein